MYEQWGYVNMYIWQFNIRLKESKSGGNVLSIFTMFVHYYLRKIKNNICYANENLFLLLSALSYFMTSTTRKKKTSSQEVFNLLLPTSSSPSVLRCRMNWTCIDISMMRVIWVITLQSRPGGAVDITVDILGSTPSLDGVGRSHLINLHPCWPASIPGLA